ncbi:MAG: ATP-dependent helicase [bacterium]|nr:ATP-dependent helicase [bacterium]
MTEVKPNEAQLKVINHSSGPLLVVAGAGTGKTFVIIERIKKLLNEGVQPESILAITFTEKAAAEMLDRLLQQLPKLQVDMPIMTFNGFGESLLREFGSHIGLGRNFNLLTDQAQLVFVRERLDALQLDYFMPLAGLPDSILSDILQVFSEAKQHLISPQQYINYAEHLPENDEPEKHEKLQHVELARLYDTYVKLCREANVIDFDDQLYMTAELLRNRPNIRKLLQNRYSSIFIDEFQDTNPMQSELIDLLVNNKQNLIVVGDDDQSIYGFRGATLANILQFKDRYPKSKEVALTQNFRSGQYILDSAYKLIQNNNPYRLETTLQIDKHLTSLEKGNPPVLQHHLSLSDEVAWIVNDIEGRIQNGDAPGSIAVLARRKITAKLLHEALNDKSVPNRLLGFSQSLYAQPTIRMMIELCHTIAEPLNNNSLHHTLTSELFELPNSEIAKAANTARYEHELLEDVLMQSPDNEATTAAIGHIRNARDSAGNTSVGRLLYNFLDSVGYKDRLYIKAGHDNVAAANVQQLSQFFMTLREFESVANQPTLIQYVAALPALLASGEQTNNDDTALMSLEEVNILTVHKAKGLEWQTVYIPDCTESSFPLKNQASGLSLPVSLKNRTSSPADEHYAEERRLMYVAVTRAKQNLVLSYSNFHRKGGAKRNPSRFINEMFGEEVVLATATTAAELTTATINSGTETLHDKVKIPRNIFDGEKVFLSVSEAAALLNCPLDFYYKFILRAPDKESPNAAYGTSLHNLFERINQSLLHKSEPIELDDLLKELSQNWRKEGYASKAQQQQAFIRAQATLKRFYDLAPLGDKPLQVEEPFLAELSEENIVLRGRYDAVFQTANGIDIRDYKTGITADTAEKAKKRAQGSIQLSMYALAWLIKHGELPATLSLYFVDTNQLGSVRKTDKGILSLRSKLAIGANYIRENSFPLGSKHDYCIHPSS